MLTLNFEMSCVLTMMWVTSDSLTPCTTASLPRVAYRVTTVKEANVIT